MKSFIHLSLLLLPFFSFGQLAENNKTTGEPRYDTTSINIQSTNSFYFCSRLYKIPRDCDSENQANCCSFSCQVSSDADFPDNGQFACYDGTSIYWTYFETSDQARASFEGYSPQIKKQMKRFSQEERKVSICNQPAKAYALEYTTFQGYSSHEVIAYGTINGHHLMIHLHSQKKLKSNTDFQSLFQEIIRFD